MKLSEIRIGNYVKVSKTETKFTAFDYSINEDLINPIPLTEEWLIKFGGKKEDDYICISFLKCSFRPDKYGGGLWIGQEGCCQTEDLCTIKYVHQLQNLYFALTSEELTTTE